MKRVTVFLFTVLLHASFARADDQAVLLKLEQPVTLEQASKAAGLNAGAQQRLVNQGIHLQQFSLGIAEAYKTKPSENRLQKARERTANELNAELKKNSSKVSVDLGLIVALQQQELLKKIDIQTFMEGFKIGYTQNVASPELAQASILVDKYYQQQRILGSDDRLIKSEEFLEKNAKREGVIVTKSGLQYEILEQGSGPKVSWMDMVTVNYRHTKPNSDFMYDSAQHNHSETMAMRGTIPEGWRELFLLMSKGARYRVYLPPALGFGAEGNGDALLPNEVLITEFTLLEIIPPPPVVY
jgi:FKBP-type peptidyl-prolyl cis-trans isomerase